jgi:hypothetical protein
MIESRARIGRKKEEGEDQSRAGNGDGFIHEVGLSGALKRGEDARAAAWLGSA